MTLHSLLRFAFVKYCSLFQTASKILKFRADGRTNVDADEEFFPDFSTSHHLVFNSNDTNCVAIWLEKIVGRAATAFN